MVLAFEFIINPGGLMRNFFRYYALTIFSIILIGLLYAISGGL